MVGKYKIGEKEVSEREFKEQVYGKDSAQVKALAKREAQKNQELANAGKKGSNYVVVTKKDGTQEVYNKNNNQQVSTQEYEAAKASTQNNSKKGTIVVDKEGQVLKSQDYLVESQKAFSDENRARLTVDQQGILMQSNQVVYDKNIREKDFPRNKNETQEQYEQRLNLVRNYFGEKEVNRLSNKKSNAGKLVNLNLGVEANKKEEIVIGKGEPVYLEIGDDGVKNNLLVKRESSFVATNYDVDVKKYQADVEAELKRQKEFEKLNNDISNRARELGLSPPDSVKYTPPGITEKVGFKLNKLNPNSSIKTQEEFTKSWRENKVTGFLFETGQKTTSLFNSMNEEFISSESKRREGFTPIEAVAKVFGKEKEATALKEKVFDAIEPVKRGVLKTTTTVADVFISDTLRDPVSAVGTYAIGGGVGKVVRYAKPAVKGLIKPVSLALNKTPLTKLSSKGAQLAFKISAGVGVAGFVGYDLLKSDDPVRRTAEITKFAILFNQGYTIGRGNLATEPYKAKSLNEMGKGGRVKSGKSPRSKASISRQNRGLSQKGNKVEKFEVAGKEVKVQEKNYWQQTKKDDGSLVVQQVKEYNIINKPQRTIYEQGKKISKIVPSQSRFNPPKFKETSTLSTNTDKLSLVQIKQQQFLVNVKRLSKVKPNKITTGRDLFGQNFKKQQLNLNKGQAPMPQLASVPDVSTQAQVVTKSQGRGKAVDKILARAKAKAEARALELKQAEIKPIQLQLQSQPNEVLKTQVQTKSPVKELTSDDKFGNMFKKKKLDLIIVEDTYKATTETIKPIVEQKKETFIVPMLNIVAQNQIVLSSQKLNQDQARMQIQSQSQDQARMQIQSQSQSQNQTRINIQDFKNYQKQTQAIDQTRIQTSDKRIKTNLTPELTTKIQPTPQPIKPITKIQPTPQLIKPKIKPETEIIKKIITNPPKQLSPKESVNNKGFAVFVRERGVFKQASNKAFSLGGAKDYGAFVVSNTPRATFMLRPSSLTVSSTPSKARGFFSRVSSNFKQKNDLFIEKKEKRISTKGELAGITRKGILANKNKKLFERLKL